MKPLVLIILDGWGESDDVSHNAIALARKPNFDSFLKNYPHTSIDGSGHAVGLPDGIMGNSEVGHMNLGAGRIVFSGLSQIYRAIEVGDFFSNPALIKPMEAAKENKTSLHLMGLLSDGAVHSHQDHLYALLDLAKQQGLTEVFIHCFMDGRDTPPREGLKYLRDLQSVIDKKKIGTIASVSGRYFAMDRDQRWDRVEKAYDVLTGAVLTGSHLTGASSPEEIILKSYAEETGDEFILPQPVLNADGNPVGAMKDGDAVIFFNFRPDRAREMTQALTQKEFLGFKRKIFPNLSVFTCMSQYDEKLPLHVAFPPNYPKRVFPEVISENGLTQLRIAETEKYAHVTYFFSGGQEKVFPGEERVLIASPKEVPTYDHKPEMSAVGITDEVLKRIESDKYDVIIMNYANADMVGHTAIPQAVVQAVEVVDECLGRVVKSVLDKKGCVIITADHGNAEQMMDKKGNPHTAHTTNLVPFVLIGKSGVTLKSGGRLCDVAPTMLELLQIPKPKEMTGESLMA